MRAGACGCGTTSVAAVNTTATWVEAVRVRVPYTMWANSFDDAAVSPPVLPPVGHVVIRRRMDSARSPQAFGGLVGLKYLAPD